MDFSVIFAENTNEQSKDKKSIELDKNSDEQETD